VIQLALINDVGERIAAVLDLESVLERAARLVQESFGYHHVALFTLDREQGELGMRTRAGDFAHLYPLDHRLRACSRTTSYFYNPITVMPSVA